MKKALLALSIFLVLSLIPLFAAAHNTMEVERDIVPVMTCPQTNYQGVECITYSVKRHDTLSYIAKRYSDEGRKLTVQFLLDLNPYLKDRPIPENLRGYSGPPRNKANADWIFPGDKITLPFVFEDDFEVAESKKMAGALVEGMVKENKKLHQELNYLFGAAAVVFAILVILIIVLLIWVLTERDRRLTGEKRLGEKRL